jgi:hypothetical protein
VTGRGGFGALAAVLVAAAALLGIGAVLAQPLPLPVQARFGTATVPLAVLQGTAAVVVPPALVAVVAVLRAAGRLERSAVLWAQLAAAPIVLFLVARLNGVVDAAALVLVYATAGGGVLLRFAQTRARGPLPIRLAAVLGIVPWGVVAFTQVGGLLVGAPPATADRALTVVVLAASVLEYVVAYRRRDVAPGRAGLLLVALPAVLLAVGVLTLG